MANEINKVNELSSLELEKIGSQVVEEYTADLESRSVWDKNNAEYLRLFSGQRGDRSIPYLDKNASNVCIPIMGVACLQFQARAYDSLMPSGNIMRAWATDGKATEEAKRVATHMNWQLTEQIPRFEKGQDKLCLKTPIFGSAYKKTFYDYTKEIVNSKLIGVDQLILPYGYEEIEDCPRVTQIIELSPNDVAIREKEGTFLNTDKLYKANDKNKSIAPGSGLATAGLNQIKQVVDEIDGLEETRLMEDKPRIFLEQHRLLNLDGSRIAKPYVVTVDEETKSVVRIVSREYTDPFTKKKEVWDYYTDYSFIPNPESHYSYGFGLLLRHLNEASNSIINELIDAGNLANMQSGYISTKSGISRGDTNFKRGEIKPVEGRTDDLKKDIFLFNFKPPSAALFTLLGLLQGYAKEISSVSEAMIGTPPSSDTTATSYMAALEQGQKVFNVIHKRMHRSFKSELKKIFLLNRLYLKEKVYFTVQNSTGSETEKLYTGKKDFINPIDVIPVSDPNLLSKAEKTAKANMVYQIVTTDPSLNQNESARIEAIKNVLEANEVQNIQKYLPSPESVQPIDYSIEEENARFLQELSSPVLPQQNQSQHLQGHNVFIDSQFGQQLTPQGKNLFESHVRETISNMYLQSTQDQSQQSQLSPGLV